MKTTRLMLPLVMVALLSHGCANVEQTPNQVLVRTPGSRTYGEPIEVQKEAVNHWQYAMLSQVAYLVTAGVINPKDTETELIFRTEQGDRSISCPDVHSLLKQEGWNKWENFPDKALQDRIEASNLQVTVWENVARAEVAIAFGGTIFTSHSHWRANLRWFIPFSRDAYTRVVEDLAPALNEKLQKNARINGWYNTAPVKVVTTGHSLGGGLAQQMAYAMPIASPYRIKQVYAFNTSPVTGFYSVDKETRDLNKVGLHIDRAFERGEILSILRTGINLVYPPTGKDPSIRTVRYSLFNSVNKVPSGKIISGHSMSKLACHLYLNRK